MGTNKSFHEILREKMTKNGSFSEGKWPNFTLKTSPIAPVAPTPLEDLLLEKTDISNRMSHFSSRETWFSLYKNEYAKYITDEVPSETAEIPPVKRNWTEAQTRAFKVLTDFGAEELSEFSSDADIKKAFRRLAKSYHPDTLVNQPENLIREKSQQFILIHTSYKDLIGSCGT
ncbi:MAG: hypothetical protein A4S09_11305 [Proteobacteria bacterium SG_bin7]|nr:MAG: hypothetical protein A4S09_11305 [Proteobacteria bacterium SG_bin7]